MKILYRMIGLTMIILLMSISVYGQASSTNYKLKVGTPVGGGGGSSSTNYIVSGAIPLSGKGVSNSTNYALVGGVASATGGFGIALNASFNRQPLSSAYKTDFPIEVVYSSPDTTATGTFYYRQGGQTNFASLTLTDNTGYLAATLPEAQLTVRGLEYYIVVQSGDLIKNIGSADEPYELIVELTNEQGQRPAAMPEGSYRIIGLPIEHTGLNMQQIFIDDLGTPDSTQWRLGRYEADDDATHEYPDLTLVSPGKGYWLAARHSKTYGVTGSSVRADEPYDGEMYYSVPLDDGWNMIANPFAYQIDWSDVVFDDNGVITATHGATILDDVVHQYNGAGYTQNDLIPAWGGAFVFIKKTGVTAMFLNKERITAGKSTPKDNSYSKSNWAVNLVLETPYIIDEYNLAGVRSNAFDGADDYDYAEPPPAPNGAGLAFKLEDDNLLRCTDFRSAFSEGAVWEIRFINNPSGKIHATNLEQIPEGMAARMIIGNRVVQLDEKNEIVIYDTDVKGYLLIGTEKYLNDLSSELLPMTFSLEQNYPNPFNPMTYIEYAIPQAGHVTLDIFNVLGQKVRSLVDGEMSAGAHTAVWDSNDNSGNSVATGVYFYRLQFGDMVKHKKMVLLK
ncbi:MAG: FlgD immunoglobulin-like domain containing protein [Candidatus Zixiibacteriota bacterium]